MTTDWFGRNVDLSDPRTKQAYAAIQYGLLLVSAVLGTFAPNDRTGWEHWQTLAVVLAAGLWLLWPIFDDLGSPRRRVPLAIYFVGLLTLIALLVSASPWYGVFAAVGYWQTGTLLPSQWRIWGAAAIAITTALAKPGALGHHTSAGSPYFFAIDIAVPLLFAAWYISRESEMRKDVIADLAEVNRRLEESMRENAGLQAQLLVQAREAGVLDERQRMAGEIHDTLAQGLAGIITQLEAAEQARHHPEQVGTHLTQARGLARESLTEARRSVRAMRPQWLEGSALPKAIARMAEHWSDSSGVRVTIDTVGEPQPLLPELDVTLFRVAQEALTNVAKHARACRVGLTLSYLDDVVLLDVRDDGVGFNPAAVAKAGRSDDGSGFGLLGMRRRLHRVAGSLEIESTVGEGTTINAAVPAIRSGSPVDDAAESAYEHGAVIDKNFV